MLQAGNTGSAAVYASNSTSTPFVPGADGAGITHNLFGRTRPAGAFLDGAMAFTRLKKGTYFTVVLFTGEVREQIK